VRDEGWRLYSATVEVRCCNLWVVIGIEDVLNYENRWAMRWEGGCGVGVGRRQ